jgi:hypothetical protein
MSTHFKCNNECNKRSSTKDRTNKVCLWEKIKAISLAINGIQKQGIYCVAAGPKVGKSTLVDVGFAIEPCLDAWKNNIPLS